MRKNFLFIILITLFNLSTFAEDFITPKDRFTKMFGTEKQIWVVGYVNCTVEESIKDLEESFNNGANAIVYESKNYKKLDIKRLINKMRWD